MVGPNLLYVGDAPDDMISIFAKYLLLRRIIYTIQFISPSGLRSASWIDQIFHHIGMDVM